MDQHDIAICRMRLEYWTRNAPSGQTLHRLACISDRLLGDWRSHVIFPRFVVVGNGNPVIASKSDLRDDAVPTRWRYSITAYVLSRLFDAEASEAAMSDLDEIFERHAPQGLHYASLRYLSAMIGLVLRGIVRLLRR